jgi:hypothetical protein
MDHGFELRRSRIRLGFLYEAKCDAERHHGRHHGSGARVARSERNRRQRRQQDHQWVADDFQKAHGPALPALLSHLIRTRRAPALFGLRLRQATGSRPQISEQFFAVLPGGIEDRG